MAQDVIYPGQTPYALEKKEIPLFGGEMPCRYQLGLTGPLYHLKLFLLANFLFN